MFNWKPSTETPDSQINKWSEEYVCMTNKGRVLLLSYFRGEIYGHWQQTYEMKKSEDFVEWWIENPQTRKERIK